MRASGEITDSSVTAGPTPAVVDFPVKIVPMEVDSVVDDCSATVTGGSVAASTVSADVGTVDSVSVSGEFLLVDDNPTVTIEVDCTFSIVNGCIVPIDVDTIVSIADGSTVVPGSVVGSAEDAAVAVGGVVVTIAGGDVTIAGGEVAIGGGDVTIGGGDVSIGGGDVTVGGGVIRVV